jgi:hypothetical protein
MFSFGDYVMTVPIFGWIFLDPDYIVALKSNEVDRYCAATLAAA